MSVSAIGQNTATSGQTTLTAPGSSNTKGAWTQISASTPEACQGFLLSVNCLTNTEDILVDIGTGAASSEVVLVANIAYQSNATVTEQRYIFIPVAIAAGTRVAARYQRSGTLATVSVSMYLLNNSNNIVLGSCTPTTYGTDTANSGGQTVDPGASTNTKGNYTQMTASTSDDIDFVYLMLGNNTNGDMTSVVWLFDIATGGAGSETVVVPNIAVRADAGTDMVNFPLIGPFPVTIASGTRLSVRSQCSSNDGTDRLLDASILGLNGTAASGGAHFSASFMG